MWQPMPAWAGGGTEWGGTEVVPVGNAAQGIWRSGLSLPQLLGTALAAGGWGQLGGTVSLCPSAVPSLGAASSPLPSWHGVPAAIRSRCHWGRGRAEGTLRKGCLLEDVDAGNPAALHLLPCCLPWALPLGCWAEAWTEGLPAVREAMDQRAPARLPWPPYSPSPVKFQWILAR